MMTAIEELEMRTNLDNLVILHGQLKPEINKFLELSKRFNMLRDDFQLRKNSCIYINANQCNYFLSSFITTSGVSAL